MKFFKEFCAFSFMSRERRNEFLQALGKLGFLPTLEKLMVSEKLELGLIKLEKPTHSHLPFFFSFFLFNLLSTFL